jgi:hypothetical protein
VLKVAPDGRKRGPSDITIKDTPGSCLEKQMSSVSCGRACKNKQHKLGSVSSASFARAINSMDDSHVELEGKAGHKGLEMSTVSRSCRADGRVQQANSEGGEGASKRRRTRSPFRRRLLPHFSDRRTPQLNSETTPAELNDNSSGSSRQMYTVR